MAISPLPAPVTLDTLKTAKNSVIGNPTAKVALAQEPAFVAGLVEALNADVPEQVKIEAAQVLSSLAFGPESAIKGVLDANAHQAILYALSRLDAGVSPALKAAYARALRVLASACADLVGPSQWSVREHDSPYRDDAKLVLDYIYQREALDVFLPLLLDTHPSTSTSIALALSASLRLPTHRTTVAEWVPPAERAKEASKPRRGWERRDSTVATRQGGWTARTLTGLVKSRDVKVQEAALSALAALAQDSWEVASVLCKPSVDSYGFEAPSPVATVLGLCKVRVSDVQLAACLCAAQIIRASTSTHHHHHPTPPDPTSSLPVLHALNRLISSPTEPPQTRSKACIVLRTLIADQKELCALSFERGSLAKLAGVVMGITPADAKEGWDEGEASSAATLRESALLALSSMAIIDNDVRRDLTDTHASLLPCISTALCASSPGVRYAACQCVRALGRSVAVARTSLVDSGLGERLYDAFAREDEVGLVTGAALMAVCNLIAEFSPLRQPFLDRGLVKRLSTLMKSGHAELRLNSLWAIKNLIYKCASPIKRSILKDIGWTDLDKLLVDPEPTVREQAFNIIRNFVDTEEDIRVAFLELGTTHLLDRLSFALTTSSSSSTNSDVLLQSASVLNNLANGSQEHKEAILSHEDVLQALRSCLVDAPMEVRRAAVHCVLELSRSTSPGTSATLVTAGILGPLRHICDNSSTIMMGGAGSTGPGQHAVEREVRDTARKAIDLIEVGVTLEE